MSALGVIVAFVGMQLAGPLSWPAIQSRYRWDCIQRAFERHRIVSVRSRDRNGQRDASCIYDDMAFAAEFSSVGRVGASFLAARGLDTLAPSILARLQSIWSCWRSLCSRARCSFAHTPAACRSRSRRQQSSHCQSPVLAANPPKEYPSAEHTRCRSTQPGHRPSGVGHLFGKGQISVSEDRALPTTLY